MKNEGLRGKMRGFEIEVDSFDDGSVRDTSGADPSKTCFIKIVLKMVFNRFWASCGPQNNKQKRWFLLVQMKMRVFVP